jgi:phosphatidate cytidylyltransferase
MKRILTAAVLIPVLLFTVWSRLPYFFVALAAIAVVTAVNEFYHLAEKVGCRPQHALGSVAGLGVITGFVFGRLEIVVAVLTALLVLSLAAALTRPEEMKSALVSVSATLFGVGYVALLAGCLVGVRMIEDTVRTPNLAAKLLTMFFAMVILTDTGAYYTGRSLGRHKLAPRISPGKTVEGFIGGLSAAVLAGYLSRLLFFPEIPLLQALILGALIGLLGPVGDLAESMLKRGSGVKDSGTLLPGHGGMLDRVDAILFCAPLLYAYTRLFASSF